MPALNPHPLITPFLWFDSQAEPAAQLYTTIFPNSRILNTLRTPVDTPSGPANSVLTVSFELDGLNFTALNGGPGHPHTDAISFVIRCESQSDIDRYWSSLTANGGKPGQCGWLKDAIRRLLAGHPPQPRFADPPPRSDAGHDAHDQARHPHPRTSRSLVAHSERKRHPGS
jgi:predicted 3-demethylubiquinone-9 3-methyltransferase (glyoxalase superfamily)